MKRFASFGFGVVAGAVLFGGTVAYAAGVMAERSNHHVTVDGENVNIEAYNINGYNYFKLGDLAEQVGFGLAWDESTSTVQIYRDPADVPQKTANLEGVVVIPHTDTPLALKVGDKVLCDDGYVYEIKDMSRYDKSAFASGPLPALPTATCDWSRFPDIELPPS